MQKPNIKRSKVLNHILRQDGNPALLQGIYCPRRIIDLENNDGIFAILLDEGAHVLDINVLTGKSGVTILISVYPLAFDLAVFCVRIGRICSRVV